MNVSVVEPVEEVVDLLENLMLKIAWYEYRRFSRELSSHELTFPQFHTLVTIYENNVKCTMGYLADETDQVSATMTGIIDRLVERGLVERWRHPRDRRKVLVRLTEAGRLKLQDVFKLRRDQLAIILGQLDAPTCNNLVFSLKQYMQALETAH
jgi:DNA-binding MarR family transcriptional regulator